MASDIFTELEIGFKAMLYKSELFRQGIHQDFAAFYYNDFLQIESILRRETLNNPFSKETIYGSGNKATATMPGDTSLSNSGDYVPPLKFQHINNLSKILNRVTSGVYTDQPVRELIIDGEENTDEGLETLLKKLKYNAKVKDAFRKAYYFNLVVVQPVWEEDTKKMRLDIITPENIHVRTKNNFLEIDAIAIRKANPIDKTVYVSVWTETEHYIEDISGDNRRAPSESNPNGDNPYVAIAKELGILALPFSVLRMTEGIDFWGEPNWNLYLNQLNADIRLTDLDRSELKTIHQIFLGINTNLPKDANLRAGTFIQIKDAGKENQNVDIKSINAGVDYTPIRENMDWRNKSVMASEGIPASSASTDVKAMSGSAKTIDERELQERREDAKEILYDFEIDLLQKIRMVNNAYGPVKLNQDKKSYFEVTFSEEKPFETVDEKIKRREMEYAYEYKDNVDFAQEDLECSEEDAIDIIKKIRQRKADLGFDQAPITEPAIPRPANPKDAEGDVTAIPKAAGTANA